MQQNSYEQSSRILLKGCQLVLQYGTESETNGKPVTVIAMTKKVTIVTL